MKLVLSAQLLKAETKPDRTLILKFNTQEVTPKEAAEIFDKSMQQLYLVLLTEEELQEEQTHDKPI
jgi:hypothetical protein